MSEPSGAPTTRDSNRVSTPSQPFVVFEPFLVVPKPFPSPGDVATTELVMRMPFTILWPPKAQKTTSPIVVVQMGRPPSAGHFDQVRAQHEHLGRLLAREYAKLAVVEPAEESWRKAETEAKHLTALYSDHAPRELESTQFPGALRQCWYWRRSPRTHRGDPKLVLALADMLVRPPETVPIRTRRPACCVGAVGADASRTACAARVPNAPSTKRSTLG